MPDVLSSAASPIAEVEFAAALARLGLSEKTPRRLALAVSGGADSMALALCCKRWQAQNPCEITCLIVDHRLRPESAVEAETVAERLRALGLRAEILRWERDPAAPRMHEAARRARYRLLTEACARLGVDALLLAHHADDQAETVLMRLCKGSGPAGLAGMAAETQRENLRLLRPFLLISDCSKERLIATCRMAEVAFVTDPSNASEKYARGRLRKIEPLLRAEGFSRESLLSLAARAREAETALRFYARAFLSSSATVDCGGCVRLDRAGLRALPRAVALRALASALDFIHRGDHPPGYAALSALLDGALGENAHGAHSLAGCLVAREGVNLAVFREPVAVAGPALFSPHSPLIWDARWRIEATNFEIPPDSHIAKLGAVPHDTLDRLAPDLRRRLRKGRVRAGLPALWRAGRLVAIPTFRNGPPGPNPGFSACLAKQGFPSSEELF